jgi:carboxymethylenebutenolidase
MSTTPPIPPSSTTGGDDSLRNYLVTEFVEDYQEGHITRREALKRLAAIFGSIALANSFLAACAPAPTPAPTATRVPPTATSAPTATTAPTSAPAATSAPTPAAIGTVMADDPAIEARMVEFDSKGAKIAAYLAKPKGSGPFPIALVCHENRGLVEHIKDVTRRLSKAGYAALAVDLLSRDGGTDKVGANVPGVLGNTPPTQFVDDFKAGLAFIQAQPFAAKDRVGMVGFCFGGGVTWRAATQIPELRAAVPFYGPNPPLEDIPNVRAAVLAIYGGNDARINAGIPAVEDAMKKANKTFDKIIYDGAGHAFHNDTGANYNANAAKDAWTKTLAWFEKYLKA